MNTDENLVRPNACVIGDEYILSTKIGWERVIAMGKDSKKDLHYLFKIKRLWWKFWDNKVSVHVGGESLRKKELAAIH